MNNIIRLPKWERRRFVIGIDPDIDESGFAAYDRETRQWRHKALYPAPLQEACLSFKQDECEIFVEAGWLNKGQNNYQFKNPPKGWEVWPRAGREAYKFDRGIDVGSNFGAGRYIIHFLRANHYQVKEYCPKIAKWDAAILKHYTGITAPTNQDVRDAVRAAFMNL